MAHESEIRLAALRGLMKAKGIDAAVIPQADPHLSEYLAPHWQLRRWLSGFTGSAGDLVVTADQACLWTDSRYFIQATRQLEGSEIELMRDGLASTPGIGHWLCINLPEGATVGVDGMLLPVPRLADLQGELQKAGIKVDASFDPSAVWLDRPEMPSGKIYVHDVAYAGESASSKIGKILAATAEAGAGAIFISALDEIAWTLNIRCDDVRHTPVATSYLFLSPDRNILFVDSSKTDAALLEYLAAEGVGVMGYTEAGAFLASLPDAATVLVDPARTSGRMHSLLAGRAVNTALSPASALKSVKNDIQLQSIRRAMVRDGVALVRSFREIERAIATGTEITEMDVAAILKKYRSQGENYRDESFGTIAGYGPHGAIVHYEATEATNSVLAPHGLLLVDSGAQYLDGTTDITRTIALGTPTAEERRDFTLVMKGHIALATMMFPDDTRGAQLDAIARQYLWRNGMSYLHGTGHGVGHFLGVHEGPQSIRLNWVDAVLRPGMITSNEPGLYRADIHGIRCENLVLCRRACTNEFGNFLRFETLTLFPFDLRLFDVDMLTSDEIEWLDSYHRTVFERLSPYLDAEERQWLECRTRSITDNLPF